MKKCGNCGCSFCWLFFVLLKATYKFLTLLGLETSQVFVLIYSLSSQSVLLCHKKGTKKREGEKLRPQGTEATFLFLDIIRINFLRKTITLL